MREQAQPCRHLGEIMSDPFPLPDGSTIVKITPEIAADWLENRNLGKNRNLSLKTAGRYAKAMSDGRWMVTHQGIAFDSDGFLIDGQHRLRAVVLAGVSVEMFVAVGFDSDTFAILDSGRRRQAGQMIAGKYGSLLAAAARFTGVADGSFTDDLVMGVYPSYAENDQVLAVVEAWPELAEYAPIATSASRSARIVPAPHLAVMAQAARTQYAYRLKGWADGVVEGTGLDKMDPRLIIRDRFIREATRLGSSNSRVLAYAYVVKAWNAWAVGADLRFLRLVENEKIPAVVA